MPVYAENVMPGESYQPATHSRRIQNLYQDILEEFRNSTKTFKKNSETPPQFKKKIQKTITNFKRRLKKLPPTPKQFQEEELQKHNIRRKLTIKTAAD